MRHLRTAGVDERLHPAHGVSGVSVGEIRQDNGVPTGIDGILLLFHCPSNTGYAIAQLERVFHRVALNLVGDERRLFYGYSSLAGGHPEHLSPDFDRVLELRATDHQPGQLQSVATSIRRARIRLAFCVDMPLRAPILRALRDGGVVRIVPYWGASISSVYPWWLLPMRRLQYLFAGSRPDHFIFESEGMRLGATHGAAIPGARTSVCPLGVDVQRFKPADTTDTYAHRQFGIPIDRKIVFYSGHMQPRKGVRALVEAMAHLVIARGRRDIHLLAIGNRHGEERDSLAQIAGTDAEGHVTFGGYRSDVPLLHRSAYLGAIASTGWDSFTMSAVEMMASGLPLLASDLPGLRETVEHGVTGFRFPVGDSNELASLIERLVDDTTLRNRCAHAARVRAERGYTQASQIECLTDYCPKDVGSGPVTSDTVAFRMILVHFELRDPSVAIRPGPGCSVPRLRACRGRSTDPIQRRRWPARAARLGELARAQSSLPFTGRPPAPTRTAPGGHRASVRH